MKYKYKAFISYSRKDSKFAARLHKNLEKYHLPASLRIANPHLPKTLGKFFKDTEDLAAHSSLDDALKETLQNSEFLIVICSTASGKSHWVNEEIKYFKSIHGEEKVIPLIIDGEPNATTNPEFDNHYEAFPEALRFEVDFERNINSKHSNPIGGDVRKGKDSKEKALVRIIARLVNVYFDDIWQREAKIRRNNLIIKTIIAIVVILSILFGIEKWFKEQQIKAVNTELSKLVKNSDEIIENKVNQVLKIKEIKKNKQKEEEKFNEDKRLSVNECLISFPYWFIKESTMEKMVDIQWNLCTCAVDTMYYSIYRKKELEGNTYSKMDIRALERKKNLKKCAIKLNIYDGELKQFIDQSPYLYSDLKK